MTIRYFLTCCFVLLFTLESTLYADDSVQKVFPVLRIAQLCDPQLGFGPDGFDSDVARLEIAVKKINEMTPDIVVITGDLVDKANNETVAALQKVFTQIKVPVLLTPGNHDLPHPVTSAGLQRYRVRFGEDFKVVECKERCIISANSQLWQEAPPEEIARHDRLLLDALQKAKEKEQPIIMITHIPPFVSSVDEDDSYYNITKTKREAILRLFNENGVILWLAGHTHKTASRSYQKITILNGETTSRNFDGRPRGFRLLTIHPDQSFDWEFILCEP